MILSIKLNFFSNGKADVKERQDITGIKDSWKEYMEKVMNEERMGSYDISWSKQGKAVCISIDEAAAALKI